MHGSEVLLKLTAVRLMYVLRVGGPCAVGVIAMWQGERRDPSGLR